MRQKSMKALEKQCNAWNAKYPTGTPVEYHSIIGGKDFMPATTTTQAMILGGHTAVVWLDGVSGCVALDACVPVKVAPLSGQDER